MAEQLDERGEPERTTHGANRTRFSARETRQAGMGVRVFLVLAASLFLALLAWAFVEWSQPDASQTGSVEPSQQAPWKSRGALNSFRAPRARKARFRQTAPPPGSQARAHRGRINPKRYQQVNGYEAARFRS